MFWIKENDNAHEACEKHMKNSQNKYKHEKEADGTCENSSGVIIVFANNTLRIVDSNCNFKDTVSRFTFNEEIK